MFTRDEAQELIDQVFQEEVLALGGMVALHEVADDLVWKLVQNMDVIRGRVLRQLKDREPPGARASQPHPAIEEFLAVLGKGS